MLRVAAEPALAADGLDDEVDERPDLRRDELAVGEHGHQVDVGVERIVEQRLERARAQIVRDQFSDLIQ